MLNMAPELISQVSQSERVWLNSGAGGHASVLLQAAPTWLEVNAYAQGRVRPLFRLLANEAQSLKDMGIRGLYLGPVGERLDIWLEEGQKKHPKNDYGQTAASLNFDPALGDDADFERLASSTETAGLELGADLPPAATGRGPDFLLQARNATGHAGLYAMLPAPKEIWPLLPEARGEWDSAPLTPDKVADLAGRGILPSSMSRDGFDWSRPGGWAATGEITGADGAQRRWIYRYWDSPEYPVFLWQDPSGQTRQIYAAAIIRQTGLQGQTLAGLRLEALMGLEPGSPENAANLCASLAPGLEALNDLSGQIHRYGGWALQADLLPFAAIPVILNGQCDFCREDFSTGLLAHAFITRDIAPLARLFETWRKHPVEQSRLARGFNAWRGIDPAILGTMPATGDVTAKMPPASADGFIPWEKILAAIGAGQDNPSLYGAFISFRLGLPGLVFIGASELAPDGPLARQKNGSAPANAFRELPQLLKNRAEQGLAQGTLAGVTAKKTTLGLLFGLPSGNFWLLAVNAGKDKAEISLKLPASGLRPANAASGADLSAGLSGDGQKFTLALDGRQIMHVLFELN